MIFNKLPLLIFLVLMGILLFRILSLQKKGVQTSAKNGWKNKAKSFLYPVFGLTFLLWLFEILRTTFSFSFSVLPAIFTVKVFQSQILHITGSIVLLLSIVLWIVTLLHFKSSLRFGLDENTQGELITNGIFSVSRNPFFLSIDLYFLGVALIFPTCFFIAFTLLAIVSIHFFILKEERFLQKIYGDEYLVYTRKTRRYF